MSKKRPKSERDIALPDWADDVTPADEVMKKFYAPTGSFTRGPISAPAGEPDGGGGNYSLPAAAGAMPDAAAARPEVRDDRTADGAGPLSPEHPHADPVELTQAGGALGPFRDQGDSLPRPAATAGGPTPSPWSDRSEPPPAPARRHAATTEAAGGAQAPTFEEFARRWNRYLYPGQLAVMRTLYELTVSLGTSECFTRYSEIAAATKMSRRNSINVMNSLAERGFVERVEVRNDATGKGIRLRVHLNPLSRD
jgi:DNA-binding MarR family transcriptional regulator